MLLDVRGTGDAIKVVQLAVPLQEANTIQLKYLRFPPLPLVAFWYQGLIDLSVSSAPEYNASVVVGRACTLLVPARKRRWEPAVPGLLQRIREQIRNR